jgi:hypothetical protein
MTQPSNGALTGPAASILRRRWFWIAFVAVLAVLAAVAGGSALADRGGLVNAAGTTDAEPPAAFSLDGTAASSEAGSDTGSTSPGAGDQGAGGTDTDQGAGNQGTGDATPRVGNRSNGQGDRGDLPDLTRPGTGEVPPVVTPPVTAPPVVTPPVGTPPVGTPPADVPPSADDPGASVEPVLTLPDVIPSVEEPPADEPEVPAVVVPQPAAVPVIAVGVAPGCVEGKAVLLQRAANEDTKGVSVNFLANADFPTSGSRSLTTAPDGQGRDVLTVTAASGKPYVGAGSISVRTYRAGQTVAGVAYPAVSETRALAYDAFTCEKPAINTNVKVQVVNGRIVLAMYAQNTGNTTVQVKFNPTAHFPGSASFELKPGAAKYLTVPTESASVPAASVSVNVVSSVQGKRVALNQVDKHDALSVAAPR